MAHADGVATFTVGVAYSPRAGEVDEVRVQLGEGATLADALRASGLLERHLEGGGLAVVATPSSLAVPRVAGTLTLGGAGALVA